ncbi:MAG: type II toxin-antitoxin system RelE/ParE family toxin [Oligoflexia bacterium]|nr:type II toxin-antitoxin system RelE/ParE family toxin [Oligoflexia bacterium]
MWKITYKQSVQKDLKKIPKKIKLLIKKAIEERLKVNPVYFGTPLRQNLKGLMKLRVGNYRIIYSVEKDTVIVFVIKIGHRKEIYKT